MNPQPINQSTNPSINQSINQLTNQSSINQPTNQPTNHQQPTYHPCPQGRQPYSQYRVTVSCNSLCFLRFLSVPSVFSLCLMFVVCFSLSSCFYCLSLCVLVFNANMQNSPAIGAGSDSMYCHFLWFWAHYAYCHFLCFLFVCAGGDKARPRNLFCAADTLIFV